MINIRIKKFLLKKKKKKENEINYPKFYINFNIINF